MHGRFVNVEGIVEWAQTPGDGRSRSGSLRLVRPAALPCWLHCWSEQREPAFQGPLSLASWEHHGVRLLALRCSVRWLSRQQYGWCGRAPDAGSRVNAVAVR